jgi:hypothetical protein
MVKNNGEELQVTCDRTGPIREKRVMTKVEQFSKVPECNKEAERAARQKKKEELLVLLVLITLTSVSVS